MKGPTTCRAIREAFDSGATTPSKLLERVFEAVESSNRAAVPLSAFVCLDKSRAREMAKASTLRFEKGETLGPLDGIPIAIKDMIDMKGLATTDGTTWRTTPAKEDGLVVERLLKVGAILFGKTSLHELGLGGTGINARHITARNPWDTDRMTGGSSSGSGAAVGAGICPIALGSDAGGSIRIPASLCGVYGFKPTFGRVPAVGAALLCETLDHMGPLAASIEGLAHFYDAIAGPDHRDEASVHQPAPTKAFPLNSSGVEGLRVAYDASFGEEADPDVARAFSFTLRMLKDSGAKVSAVDLGDLKLVQKVGLITLGVEAAFSQREHLKKHRGEFGLDARLLLAIAGKVTAVEYLHAQAVRAKIRRRFESLFASHDVFISPTTACAAPPIHPDALTVGEVDAAVNDRLARYSFLANLTGMPSISLPAGLTPEGLPIGLMLMSRPWSEAALLSWSKGVDGVLSPLGEVPHGVELLP